MPEFFVDPSAVLWSGPLSALSERPLLVLLHGRGSHEGDLFSLADLFADRAVVASLRAPLTQDEGAYAWFTPSAPGLPTMESANASVAAVLAWLDTISEATTVGLLGFSQGGAMTTHLLRHAPERFSAYVNLAGFSIQGELPEDAALQTLRPSVFWGRGLADRTIPPFAIERTQEWLPVHSTLTAREYPELGHSISQEELADVSEFLDGTLFA